VHIVPKLGDDYPSTVHIVPKLGDDYPSTVHIAHKLGDSIMSTRIIKKQKKETNFKQSK
jgi:hypothetical protein